MATDAAASPTRSVLIAAMVVALALVTVPFSAATATPTGGGHDLVTQQALRELSEDANRDGLAPGIVTLELETQPESELDARQTAVQRRRIAGHQAALLQELVGVPHRVRHRFTSMPALAVEVSEAAVQRLRRSSVVGSIAVDEPLTPWLEVSGPLVKAELAHDAGVTGLGTVVAVLDTGVDRSHEAFEGRIVDEACFSRTSDSTTSLCPNGTDVQLGSGAAAACTHVVSCDHGTHVAGIAVGAGPVVTGIAPGAGLMAVQVFHEAEVCAAVASGCLSSNTSDMLRGLEHVYGLRDTHDIAAVNLSLGGKTFDQACDHVHPLLTDMLADLRAAGIAPVAASGNDGQVGRVATPACISSAIAVGATDLGGAPAGEQPEVVAWFSDGHPDLLDLLAPGTPIRAALPGGGYGVRSGTSMAAPHVAGAFALMRERHPLASVDALLADLRETGVPVVDDRTGAGDTTYPRLSLESLANPVPEVEPCPGTSFPDVPLAHRFCPEIGRSVDAGIVKGYADGTFRPRRSVSRQAAVSFLHGTVGAPAGPFPDPGFADVGPDHRFRTAIWWAAANGVTRGFPDGTFKPRRDVTRQAAASFLHSVAGTPTRTSCDPGFADVDGDHRFCQAIAWAVDVEVTFGYQDGSFRPIAPMTRQAMVAFIDRA